MIWGRRVLRERLPFEWEEGPMGDEATLRRGDWSAGWAPNPCDLAWGARGATRNAPLREGEEEPRSFSKEPQAVPRLAAGL